MIKLSHLLIDCPNVIKRIHFQKALDIYFKNKGVGFAGNICHQSCLRIEPSVLAQFTDDFFPDGNRLFRFTKFQLESISLNNHKTKIKDFEKIGTEIP